jgi:hypothetical protein
MAQVIWSRPPSLGVDFKETGLTSVREAACLAQCESPV